MKLLWIATKAPWPPADGGRLVLLETLRALAARGHEIALVAPSLAGPGERAAIASVLEPWCRATLVPAAVRPPLRVLAGSLLGGEPWTLRRHRAPAVRAAAERLLAEAPFEAVIGEQLQAVAQIPGRRGGEPGPARVLRAENVESELWRAAASLGGWRGPPPPRPRRGARAGGGAPVEAIPAPFPSELPGGPPVAGAPAVVLFSSGGWAPNSDQARWFVGAVWPRVLAALPAARLHGFGDEQLAGAGVDWHPSPADSRIAFAAGSIFVVPLRVGSGVRMKILEAWARRVPVVATPEGAAGLAAAAGRELLVAEGAEALAAEVVRLAGDPGLRERLVAAAGEALAREHAPFAVATAWQDLLTGLRSR